MVELAEIKARPVLQMVWQRGHSDCGIAVLAMYLGLPYEDVLAAAVATTQDHNLHKHGTFDIQVKRIAKFLGTTLHKRHKWDWEESCGIVWLVCKKLGHVVLLKHGLIFDTNGTVWQPEVYLANSGFAASALLTQD